MRRLERQDLGAPANTITTLLTVPAAHKFEIVTLGLGSAGTHAHQILLAYGVGGTITQFFDEVRTVVGQYAVARNYEAVVIGPGEDLIIFAIDGAGTEAVSCNVHYVDVSPV